MLRGVALAFAAAVVAAPAFAADVVKPVPVIASPVVVANPLDGFYLGGNAGYAWGTRKGCFEYDEFPIDRCNDGDPYYETNFNYSQHGWLLGGQVGINHFFNYSGHSLFIGAEVNDDVADISGKLEDLGVGTYSNVGSAMAKLGIGLSNNMAIYAEAGIGIASFNFNGVFCSFDQQNSGFGWGIGAEAAVGGHNSLFAKWDQFNFAAKDTACSTGGGPVFGVKTTPTLDVFRVGFNHYFN
jgi:outer membrane immunogenic protein